MFPQLGHGVGLRTPHYTEFLESNPAVDWVEAISENFMGLGGRPLAVLEKVRRDTPVVLHGVSLNIGSVAELDQGYLKTLKDLVQHIEPAMVSDHLCWGRWGASYSHDLLPLPFTEEALNFTCERIQRVQDFLGRKLLIENVSSYLTFESSHMTEWHFLNEVARRADCGLLLDLNNIYVSGSNHGFRPLDYIEGIDPNRVGQFHLAGHTHRGDILIDTHEGQVSDAVWALYEAAVARFGPRSTLIEWDEGIPALNVLLAESKKAQRLETNVLESVCP
jgi:uncharacterized protein